MAPSPQRPFVPHRTPDKERPPTGSSEFRLARPFVPGAKHDGAATVPPVPGATAPAEPDSFLQPIKDYLHSSPLTPISFAPDSIGEKDSHEFDEMSDELPPVEHFLDPLPRLRDLAPEVARATDSDAGGHEGTAPPPPSDSLATELAGADWRQYGSRSAALPSETGESAASSAWAATDWDANRPQGGRGETPGRPTPAQAIASALDQIAQRIRDGDLSVPAPGPSTDPATIAATLAALLGIRHKP